MLPGRAQRVVRVVLTGQADASGSHFTDELSVDIPAQGYKGSYARKRGEIPILIGLQDRDHSADARRSRRLQRAHGALAVHDHSRDLAVSCVLFIPLQKYRDAHGEMLVSAMGGNAQGMAVLVVQQQERAAPQNDAQTPDQSAGEKHVTVDGLTMPIDRSRVSVWGWAVSSARACGGC